MSTIHTTNELLATIPRELRPSFDEWDWPDGSYACHSDAAGIRDFAGEFLWIGLGGGGYADKAKALATKTNLCGLCIDGRSIPQPIVDAVGSIRRLKRLQMDIVGKRSLLSLTSVTDLESLYLGGVRGPQDYSVPNLKRLRSLYVGGDTEAVTAVLRGGHPRVRYLALGGAIESSNLRLGELELLQAFPSLEYLELFNVSVASRSLEPCQSLQHLRCVIVNSMSRWKKQPVQGLISAGVPVYGRIDRLRAEMRQD